MRKAASSERLLQGGRVWDALWMERPVGSVTSTERVQDKVRVAGL
jgi:hypothetical protein